MKLRLSGTLVLFVSLFLLAAKSPAFEPPSPAPLPDFDKRTDGLQAGDVVSGNQRAAVEQLRLRLPLARVDFDPVTGAPKMISAGDKFLSGTNGQGRAISAATAAGFTGDPHRATKAFLCEHRRLFGYGPEVLNQARVKREFVTPGNGMKTVVWEQQVNDIPVFEAVLVSHTTVRGELVNLSSQFVPNPENAADQGVSNRVALVAAPSISARKAVTVAARNIGETVDESGIVPVPESPQAAAVPDPEKHQAFKSAVFKGAAEAKLVWLPMNPNRMRLCWDVILMSRAREEMFRVLVDVQSGEPLLRHCLTDYLSEATYRVYTSDSPSPFSPGYSTPTTSQPPLVSRTLLTFSALDTNASPAGWINDGGNETLGNNVDAHTDRNADNLPDLPRPQGSPFRVFDFPLDLTQAPGTYTNAAVVQLFYWNNFMHDKLYGLGFTEAAGNFQSNNFSRGGLGNDAVQADAQDGSGVNNANFSTPPDGSPGRMQMYLFTGPNPDRDGDLDAEVVLHEYTHGLSNRRVGGGVGISALQSAGMGEGWSDFYAMALLSEPGDDVNGVYAYGGYATYQLSGLTQNYYFGIRRYPYCTDMSKNPLTFKDIDPAQASSHSGIPCSPIIGTTANEVHNMGEVWCMTLREAWANLIAKYGWAVGNQLILQLVTDGMNLSPANPNFLQARDAILQADQVDNGGADLTELWAAFAKRGMGFSATSPSSSTTTGLHEAFDIPDDLRINPDTGFSGSGPVGGPFTPNSVTFTLTNVGSNSLSWTLVNTSSWLNVFPVGGTLTPGGLGVSVTAGLDASVGSLPMGIYTATVWFTNLTSQVVQNRQFMLRVGQPDYFTELFDTSVNDLAFQTFTFTPDGSGSFYALCREPAASFPTDPTGGTAVTMSDDTYAQVTLSGTNTVAIYGRRTNIFYIGSNGYLTMDSGDTTYEESLAAHFNLPRVSALFDDLLPSTGQVTWKQMSNHVAVTYLAVPEYGATSQTNSFQMELFFDGRIRLTYLGVKALDGLAGLSAGTGVPAGFVESDLSSYGSCSLPLFVVVPPSATEGAGVLAGAGQVRLLAAPTTNLTVALSSGDPTEVTVPANVTILAGQTNAAFDLTIVDDGVLDGTQTATLTASASGYNAGSANITVFDNETATLGVVLPATATEGQGTVTGAVQVVGGIPAANIMVSLSSSDTTEIQVPASVTIPSGQTSAVFTATVVDDNQIDGSQTAIVTAHVQNWTDGSASITVFDNENLNLTVVLPSSALENAGVLTNAGSVSIFGTLPTNLIVSLASDTTNKLTVPPTVTIPAGQLSSTFNLTLVDNTIHDGDQTVTVSASTSGFTNWSASMLVVDDDIPPAIVTQPANQTTAIGGLAAFAATAIGKSPLNYQWYFNGVPLINDGRISGATTASLAIANAQTNDAGFYGIVVTNAFGSATSSNATLNVYPVPIITAFSPASGSVGTTVTINGNSFDPTASNNIVYFGAVRAVVSAASVTNLVVTVPVGATYAPITVTVNGFTAYANAPFLVTFTGSGVINSASLTSRVDLASINGPYHMIIADLDGDGKPDVVTLSSASSPVVSIYRNISTNGTLGVGSFAPRVDLPAGSLGGGGSIAVADVDSDGRLDVVVANYAINAVSVFKNQCVPGSITTNSFGARVDFPVGPGPTGVAVQDLDGDGKPEIVAANYGGTTVSVLRNIGTMGSITTNSFAPAVSFTVGPTPVNVMIADVDGDGKADVVTVNNGNSSQAMSVLRNLGTLGNISFATNVDFPGLSTSYCLAIGDLDGDGKLDMVIGSQPGGQSVSVYRNTSTPGNITTNSFAPHVDFAAGGWVNGVAIGDLDGDGKPDVAAGTQIPSHLSLFKNTSTPGSFTSSSFAARVDYASGWNPNGVAIGDLDGDGRPDIAFANNYDNTVSLYQNVIAFGGPPAITSQPTNQTVTVGGRAGFSVAASGSLPLSYQWNFNGTNIAGATNTSLTLTNVQLSQAGNYAVLVTNAYGWTNSSNAVLTVNPPPPCDPPPSGLVSWWPGEGNANDVVGTNNGTLVNGAGFATGEVGQAFSFDDTSYVSIPDSPSLDSFTTSITIELWLKVNQLTANSDWKGIVTKGASSWRLQGTTWAKSVTFSMTGVSPNVDLIGSRNVNDGQWHHVAGVYDGTNMFLYVDGTLDVSQPATGSISQNNYPVCIGENAQMLGYTFNGLIDEVSLYNRALRAAEIQLLYAAGSGGKCYAPPAIISQPTNQTVTAGGTANFSVTASGTPPLSYQWRFGGTNIVGATNTTLTLTNVQLSQAGNYSVLVTNLFGSILSSNAVLTVSPPSPGIPVIFGFNPISGAVGTGVTISGTNFSPVLSNNLVYFGAVRAVVNAASVTNLVVTVPAGATYAPITETVGGLVAYANTAFQPTFLGDGSGIGSSSFAPRVDMACGSGPYLTSIADLDGDGKPDLVAVNYYDGNISLFRNISTNSTLSFAPRVDLPSFGGAPLGLAVADVDGDGKLDLVVSDSSNNRVMVFRNISTVGTLTTNSFAAPVAFSVGNSPAAVRVRDLDGDGRPDIVCVNYGDSTLSILRNIRTAGSLTTNSFAPQVVLATGSEPHDLVIVDLDGDGKPDLAQVNCNSSFLSVFRNVSVQGVIDTNSFAPRVDFPASGMGDSIVAGDVDGDGKVDLVAGWSVGSAIAVYRNLASPGSLDTNSFAAEVDFPAPGWVRGVAMGDLNGDGKPDISLVGEENNFMSVYQNVSTPGSFTNTSLASRVDYGAGWNPHGVMIGDLDGDGRPDIIFGNQYDNTISIYRNVTPFGGAPIITTQPTNQTVNVGGAATFTVVASGAAPLSYQWSFGGTNILGATNTTLTLTNVQLSQAGNYAVLVTNAVGSILSSNAVLTVTLDHFAWNSIPSPRFVNTPFSVTIQARNLTNGLFTNFTGTAILGSTNGVAVTPPVSGNFVQGVWTGAVVISQTASNLVLRANDGLGHFGLANPINVISLPRLGMLRSGNIALYMWPVGYSGFVLETSGNLSPATWVVIPYSPIQIGDQYLLPLDMTGTNGFYRLWFPGP